MSNRDKTLGELMEESRKVDYRDIQILPTKEELDREWHQAIAAMRNGRDCGGGRRIMRKNVEGD